MPIDRERIRPAAATPQSGTLADELDRAEARVREALFSNDDADLQPAYFALEKLVSNTPMCSTIDCQVEGARDQRKRYSNA